MAERTLEEQHQYERDYYLQRRDKEGKVKVDKIGGKLVSTLKKEFREFDEKYDPNSRLPEKYRKLAAKSAKTAEEEARAIAEAQPQATVVTYQTIDKVILPSPVEEKGSVKTAKEQTEANEKTIEGDKKTTENPPKT